MSDDSLTLTVTVLPFVPDAPVTEYLTLAAEAENAKKTDIIIAITVDTAAALYILLIIITLNKLKEKMRL